MPESVFVIIERRSRLIKRDLRTASLCIFDHKGDAEHFAKKALRSSSSEIEIVERFMTFSNNVK